MPVPSVISTAWSAPARRARTVLGEDGHVRVVVHNTGRPSRSLIRSRNGKPSSGRWFETITEPVPGRTSAGMPKPDRRRVRGHRAGLFHGLHEGVEQLRLVEPERSAGAPDDAPTSVSSTTPAEQLGAAGVDTDDAPRRHARTLYTTW